ncbi:hypothetical protein P8605_45730, partial [Streptomyces sp. T-3]|nr:hypothetical protein [Streptomyces sp. T-3]
AVPLDGGPARVLPYGPVGDVAHGPGGEVLVVTVAMGREASYWKRYRGGTAGKLWINRDSGAGEGAGEFVRVHQELDGNLEYP